MHVGAPDVGVRLLDYICRSGLDPFVSPAAGLLASMSDLAYNEHDVKLQLLFKGFRSTACIST